MQGMLEGKVALITGAGQGIGEATALLMAREGASVLVADVNPETGRRTAEQVVKNGGRAHFVQTDVTREDQVASMVQEALRVYGRLDCAFNNAGFGNMQADLHDIPESDFNRTVALCLDGVFLCMKHEIPAMLQAGGGAIVNTSSNAALRATLTQAAYCAAKAGVIGMSRTAAVEYASQNIRINVICPGLIMTPAIRKFSDEGVDWSKTIDLPMGRPGEPEEIAEVATWLCSPRSSYVTGHVISVDGGMMAA